MQEEKFAIQIDIENFYLKQKWPIEMCWAETYLKEKQTNKQI